jgi:hypothetical protein
LRKRVKTERKQILSFARPEKRKQQTQRTKTAFTREFLVFENVVLSLFEKFPALQKMELSASYSSKQDDNIWVSLERR